PRFPSDMWISVTPSSSAAFWNSSSRAKCFPPRRSSSLARPFLSTSKVDLAFVAIVRVLLVFVGFLVGLRFAFLEEAEEGPGGGVSAPLALDVLGSLFLQPCDEVLPDAVRALRLRRRREGQRLLDLGVEVVGEAEQHRRVGRVEVVVVVPNV